MSKSSFTREKVYEKIQQLCKEDKRDIWYTAEFVFFSSSDYYNKRSLPGSTDGKIRVDRVEAWLSEYAEKGLLEKKMIAHATPSAIQDFLPSTKKIRGGPEPEEMIWLGRNFFDAYRHKKA